MARKNSSNNNTRFLQIVSILRKYKVNEGLDPVKLRNILEELGPTFVKIGQILSNRQDIFSERYCRELMKLRSNVKPMPIETVRKVLEEAYHKPWDEVFTSFDEEPLGAASIAQVHAATLPTGESVVVKVQRPGIYETMERDVKLLRRAARVMNLSDAVSSVVDLDMVIDEFWETAKEEMDFTIEAVFAQRFKQAYKDCKFIDAPIIYTDYSTKYVLVMEYVDGLEINNHMALEQAGYDCKEIADKLAYNYITQIIDKGFFHADPHSGNLRIRNHQIVWIDFGMMGTLDAKEREVMREVVKAVGTKDVLTITDCILTLGNCQKEIDYMQLMWEIEQFMLQYVDQSFEEIDIAKMIQEVFAICHKYRIQLPKGVSMLARSMMTMEGTLMDLDPQCNIMKIAMTHKDSWRTVSTKDVLEKGVKKGARITMKTMDLPVQTSDLLRLAERGRLKLNLNVMGSAEPIAKVDRMVNRLIVCILIAALLIGSSLLCMTNMEPRILGIPAIGFLGFMIAFAMSIWLFVKMLFLHRRNKMF
ncbi:ABC1 kinase family protein [Catenisphaera adipataccumulans]|uniref:Ubiquinone biosynthesis protein n=1 Tax=Catenisphaera adipataccumulans TaxID=700500 RepID=A0A7W8CYZ0_9FIRM|nr:lipopolysaccharide core heptose(II) kinase RfaY [Catenisphaera adipataccumulans]MBB5183599.1 ubiquinone biosynthesis protein [Catenisphaera adipataccumulans]